MFFIIISFKEKGNGADYSKYKDQNKLQEEIKKEIEAYKKDDNNRKISILDMTKNPYFLQKLQAVTYPEVKEIEYFSKVTKSRRKAALVLPKDYDKTKEYPLLVAMHGYEGSYKTWLNKNIDVMLANLQKYENIKDMIVLLPDSNLNEKNHVFDKSLYEATIDYDKTEKDLMENLLPYVEKHYKIKKERENRAICGLSLGGRNALYIGFKNSEKFGYIGAFSPEEVAKDDIHGNELPVLLDNFKLKSGYQNFFQVSISGGSEDFDTGKKTAFIHEKLDKDGIEHTYYLLKGGHTSEVWQGSMYNFLKMIFIK